MLDIIVLLVMFICTLRGYQRGVVRNVLELLAFAVAWVASVPLWFIAGKPLMLWAGWSYTASYLVGRLIVGAAIYVPLLFAAIYLDRRLGRTREGGVRDWNKAFGAAFGLMVGIALGFVLLFLADALVQAFPEKGGTVMWAARRSILRRVVGRANPARRFMVTDVMELLHVAKRDPEVLERLMSDPRIRQLLTNPTLRKLQDDDSFADNLKAGRIAQALSNENLQAVLADKELRADILSPETRSAIQAAIQDTQVPAD